VSLPENLEAYISKMTTWLDALNGDEHMKTLRVAVFTLLRDLSQASLAPNPAPVLADIVRGLNAGTSNRLVAFDSDLFRDTPVGQLVFRWQRTVAEELTTLLAGVDA
jgi:hypothetical protein